MVGKLKEILDVFFSVGGIVINSSRSMVTCWGYSKLEKLYSTYIFPFLVTTFETCFKIIP
jgi:hypothetical protein